ncbi:MAG: RadC family protein [Exilispira sp.]
MSTKSLRLIDNESHISMDFILKCLKKIIKFDDEKGKKIVNFFYNSIYSQNFILDFELKKEDKEKLFSILRLVQYFIDFKLRWPATITSAESVVKFIKNFCAPDRETFLAIYLNSQNNVLYTSIISYGTTDFALVNIKMIFSYALKYDATKIILAHNHPSGDPAPSSEDIAFTEKVLNLAKEFSIVLLDHIIIANTYYSFKLEGII